MTPIKQSPIVIWENIQCWGNWTGPLLCVKLTCLPLYLQIPLWLRGGPLFWVGSSVSSSSWFLNFHRWRLQKDCKGTKFLLKFFSVLLLYLLKRRVPFQLTWLKFLCIFKVVLSQPSSSIVASGHLFEFVLHCLRCGFWISTDEGKKRIAKGTIFCYLTTSLSFN